MSRNNELTRAEVVRQRRSQQNTQRLQKASQQAYRPKPAVTTRAAAHAMPAKKSRQPRRFSISMLLPTIEQAGFAPRSLPHAGLGWRGLSIFLTFSLSAAIYFSWTAPFFRADQALVTGNTRLGTGEINAALGIAGRPVFGLMPDEIVARLRLNYPELASVNVRIYLPNQVWVRVTERTPLILWQEGSGYTWIDAFGVAFTPHGQLAGLIQVVASAAPPAGAPLLNDPLTPTPYLSQELVDAIQILAPHVPTGSSLVFDPGNGLGWNDNRGWQVFFGNSSRDMPLRLRIYHTLIDSLIGRGIYPNFISVVYPDAPFYRAGEVSQEVLFTSDVDSGEE